MIVGTPAPVALDRHRPAQAGERPGPLQVRQARADRRPHAGGASEDQDDEGDGDDLEDAHGGRLVGAGRPNVNAAAGRGAESPMFPPHLTAPPPGSAHAQSQRLPRGPHRRRVGRPTGGVPVALVRVRRPRRRRGPGGVVRPHVGLGAGRGPRRGRADRDRPHVRRVARGARGRGATRCSRPRPSRSASSHSSSRSATASRAGGSGRGGAAVGACPVTEQNLM